MADKKLEYQAQAYGFYGRNRTAYRTTLRLGQRATDDPMPLDDVVRAAEAALREIKWKRGNVALVEQTIEVATIGGQVFETHLMGSGTTLLSVSTEGATLR